MFRYSRRAFITSTLSVLILSLSAATTRAQKGGTGGGGSAAGGAGGGVGGGTSTNPLKGVTAYPIALTGSDLFPTAVGVATLSFNTLGTYRVLNVQINMVDLPDDSDLTVTFYDDAKFTAPAFYYGPVVYYPQYAGMMTVKSASASLSFLNGDPNMPLFGKNGYIQVTANDASGNSYLIAAGSYTALGGP